jgi:hypothetical protein
MNCSDAEPLITGFADGELDPESLEPLEAHLNACPPCRRYLEEGRDLKEAVSRLPLPEPPPELSAELRRLARAESGTGRGILRFAAPAAGVLFVAAVLLATQIFGPSPAAEASVRELMRMHVASQAADARYCRCCKDVSDALGKHIPGKDLQLPAHLKFRGFMRQPTTLLQDKVPCFATETGAGQVTMFYFETLPPLPQGRPAPDPKGRTCIALEASDGSLVVVCTSAGHQIWVGKMRGDQLLDVVLAR